MNEIVEKNEPVANCDRFNTLKHSSSKPYVFTEQGVSMLSAVLRSETAIKTSIQIINSFVSDLIRSAETKIIGASLKDLGKKWFAFSKMDMKSFDVLNRLDR